MVVTNRKSQILDFIKRFQDREGFGPTVREICHALGLKSPGSLMKHLAALEEEGLLARTPGKNRTWRVVGDFSGPSIPLLGSIAAGTPILAQDNKETDLPVDPALFGCRESFALTVKGDSMIEAHIMDGDLAVIRPTPEAENGRIVAVLVQGLEPEATLKIFRRENDRIVLLSANPEYEPLVFSGGERSRVTIIGVLAGVIRYRP